MDGWFIYHPHVRKSCVITQLRLFRIDDEEHISLTDLARYANPEEPKTPIYAWMRNKDVLAYLGLWEQLNNIEFKGHEFETFENEAGKNSFYMSPQKWIKETNAIAIFIMKISKVSNSTRLNLTSYIELYTINNIGTYIEGDDYGK